MEMDSVHLPCQLEWLIRIFENLEKGVESDQYLISVQESRTIRGSLVAT